MTMFGKVQQRDMINPSRCKNGVVTSNGYWVSKLVVWFLKKEKEASYQELVGLLCHTMQREQTR